MHAFDFTILLLTSVRKIKSEHHWNNLKKYIDKDCLLFLSLNPEIDNFGVLGGDSEIQSVGRPSKSASESRKAGGGICYQITSEVRENKSV